MLGYLSDNNSRMGWPMVNRSVGMVIAANAA